MVKSLGAWPNGPAVNDNDAGLVHWYRVIDGFLREKDEAQLNDLKKRGGA